jgi:type I restriction enzyme S subunit
VSVVLREHLQLLAAAPEGIQKLRGLILELAVRGKLVPQDPNDEPASGLLKRIAQERARLERVKASKANDQGPLGDHASSFELPESWAWVRFGEIALHNAGKTLDKSRNAGQPRDYITTSNLYWGRFELSDLKQMLIGDDELERCTAKKDDLLICEGGEAGRAAVWPYEREVCFQNHVHRARFFGGIDPYFGFRFFEWLNASGRIDKYRKGVGISNMSGKALASIPFTLPPLAEQHRIVAKVDELMALCDRLEAEQADAESAHAKLVDTLLGTLTQSTDAADLAANWQRLAEHFDALFTSESSLNALKQTILQLAVMGKLVPQDPNDEPASELLKRIEQERARLEAKGMIKKSKPMLPVEDHERQHSIPALWEYVRLQDLCSTITDGTHQTPKYTDNGRPFLSAQNVKPFRFMPENFRYVSEEDYQGYIKSTKPELGDVLLTRVGAMIGEAAVIDKELDFAIYVSLALLKPIRSLVSSEYVVVWLNSPFGTHASIRDTLGRGVSAGNLNLGMIRAFALPLPPIAEQHRIVAKVDELMALCDNLKADLAESRCRQERLASTLIESALKAA